MAWLLRDQQVLAPVEVADGARGRARGLLGRDGVDGALLLTPARSIHTFGMRFAIDVAYLDKRNTVLATTTMPRNRLGKLRLRAHSVLEAEAGAFGVWALQAGDELEIRP